MCNVTFCFPPTDTILHNGTVVVPDPAIVNSTMLYNSTEVAAFYLGFGRATAPEGFSVYVNDKVSGKRLGQALNNTEVMAQFWSFDPNSPYFTLGDFEGVPKNIYQGPGTGFWAFSWLGSYSDAKGNVKTVGPGQYTFVISVAAPRARGDRGRKACAHQEAPLFGSLTVL